MSRNKSRVNTKTARKTKVSKPIDITANIPRPSNQDSGRHRNTLKERVPEIGKRYRNWFFTDNTVTKDLDCTKFTAQEELKYRKLLEEKRKKFEDWLEENGYLFRSIQIEIGKEGKWHLQGTFGLVNGKTISTLVKTWPGVHWELTEKKEAAQQYCAKEDTRMAGTEPSVSVQEKEPLWNPLAEEGIKFYSYQKEILDMIENDKNRLSRIIHWYWGPIGDVGKSMLVRYIMIKYSKECLIIGGKAKDIAYSIKQYVDNNWDTRLKIVLIDLPRTFEEKISYEALEFLKTGNIFSPKFESGMCIINPVHVFVFANERPDTSRLSKDKWHIVNVEEEMEKLKEGRYAGEDNNNVKNLTKHEALKRIIQDEYINPNDFNILTDIVDNHYGIKKRNIAKYNGSKEENICDVYKLDTSYPDNIAHYDDDMATVPTCM